MKNKFDETTWIFVVVQDPGKNEQYFGLHDEKTDVSYIPAFQSRDDAQSCLIHLPTQRGKKYEVQAIMRSDLSRDAFTNNFLIFMLNEDGKIVDKIYPGQSHESLH